MLKQHSILLAAVIVSTLLSGCAAPARESAAQGSRQGVQGSRHSARLQQPPAQAAACFARNAEEHSSALVAEVRPGRDSAEVIVRVKNGMLYGTADFRIAGSGSAATITLNVATTGRRSDLLDALTQGC